MPSLDSDCVSSLTSKLVSRLDAAVCWPNIGRAVGTDACFRSCLPLVLAGIFRSVETELEVIKFHVNGICLDVALRNELLSHHCF